MPLAECQGRPVDAPAGACSAAPVRSGLPAGYPGDLPGAIGRAPPPAETARRAPGASVGDDGLTIDLSSMSQEKAMKTKTKAPRRARTRSGGKATTAAAPAQTERVQRRELERAVSLTCGERLRSLWYRLRLTIAEMNYATRRLAELQQRLPP